MATFQDCSLGLALETTYGTAVTVSRFLEFTGESLDLKKTIKQGQGLRVGSRVARSNRRVVPTISPEGDINLELIDKGLGLLLQACFGQATSTMVSTGLYQQVFTLSDIPPSMTLQKGMPKVDGTVDAYTVTGCTVDNFTFDFKQADIATMKVGVTGRDILTNAAYAAPSYPTGGQLFHFAQATIYSGAFTAPTTTALASAGTALASVRECSIDVKKNVDQDRFNFGGGGRRDKPTNGVVDISGKLRAEHTSNAFAQAVINETPMSLVITYTAGTSVFQVALPEIKFDSELPKTNGGDLITQELAFAGLDNLVAAQPIWCVVRTSDAAL